MPGVAKTRAELYALFESGDKPTAQDFMDLIASFSLVDGSEIPDPLPAVSGQNLTNLPTANPLPAVDGSQLTGINIGEWNHVVAAPNYADATSFVLSGDLTATYLKDRRVRLTIDGDYFYSHVESSVYAAGTDTTTVVISDAVATNLLTDSDVSTLTPILAGGGVSARMAGSVGGQFLVHEADTPDLTLVIDAGTVQDGVTLTAVAKQITAVFVAPAANPRIDRIVIDVVTGVYSVVPGDELADPVAPEIPVGKRAAAQIRLETTTAAITNSMITDERSFIAVAAGSLGFDKFPGPTAGDLISLGNLTTLNKTIIGLITSAASPQVLIEGVIRVAGSVSIESAEFQVGSASGTWKILVNDIEVSSSAFALVADGSVEGWVTDSDIYADDIAVTTGDYIKINLTVSAISGVNAPGVTLTGSMSSGIPTFVFLDITGA